MAVVFQYKILPPSESFVRNPTAYLTSYPAKIFPLEKSLLPSIPMHKKSFREISFDRSTTLYRMNGFDSEMITLEGQPKTAEFVIYQLSDTSPVSDITINVTAPTLIRLYSSENIVWEQEVFPNKPADVKFDQKIFKRKYFDIMSNKFLRWAPIKLELITLNNNSVALHVVDISFANKEVSKEPVFFSEIITVHNFQNKGILKFFDWSSDEAWGVWTDGSYAGLSIPLPEATNSDVKLTFSMNAYVLPEHPVQRVDVFISGELFDHWEFTHSANTGIRELVLDKKSISDGKINVIFEILNPASPDSLGLGADPRILGIGLNHIRIDRHE
jgi:hypothetical protein